MQKNTLLIFISISIAIFFGFYTNIFAETVSTSTDTINAEILTNIWYSTTTINENDSIYIYAGFQNHSNENISGIAGFFVDDTQIYKINFIANPKSLIKLETEYKALRGDHKVQVKIIDISLVGGSDTDKLSIDSLLSKESEKSSFSVKYKISKTELLDNIKQTTNNIVNTTDTYANKLADYVESLKSPDSASSTSMVLGVSTINDLVGKVLGTSTEKLNNIKSDNKDLQTKAGFSFYNLFLDMLTFIIRNWLWTLLVVVIFIFFLAFR